MATWEKYWEKYWQLRQHNIPTCESLSVKPDSPSGFGASAQAAKKPLNSALEELTDLFASRVGRLAALGD